MPFKIRIRWQALVLGALLLLALLLRLYGLNWDQGHNFHPDERQILFRVTALGWPQSWAHFLDAQQSPLNPHFFAYGSFPLYLLALVGTLLRYNLANPEVFFSLTLAGRVISALFDCGTILLTSWLALRLPHAQPEQREQRWYLALLVATLLAFTPLHLQLSHFYAVDTILVFFVMLTLLACVTLVQTPAPIRWSLLAGVGFGLAMATKISAFPLLLPIALAVFLRWWRERDLVAAWVLALLPISVAFALFILTQPYVLLDRENFITQVLEQSSMARGDLDYPYTRQFAGTVPYLYHLQNMLLWGLGLALGCCALLGLCWLLWRLWQREAGLWIILLAWVLAYVLVTGGLYVKFMRYQLPVYPALVLIGSAALLAFLTRFSPATHEQERLQWMRRRIPLLRILPVILVVGGTIFQGLALTSIYSQPNTRVQASQWMYDHIPQGSVITYEQWDDALPVRLDQQKSPEKYMQATYSRQNAQGQSEMQQGLDLYGPDTVAKARELAELLPKLDAITMASDRLYGSIPRLPERYPLTINYYRLLFNGELGFRLAAQFENHPQFLGLALNDRAADESYSVFDHPTVRIFTRVEPYPYTSEQLLEKLLEGIKVPVS